MIRLAASTLLFSAGIASGVYAMSPVLQIDPVSAVTSYSAVFAVDERLEEGTLRDHKLFQNVAVFGNYCRERLTPNHEVAQLRQALVRLGPKSAGEFGQGTGFFVEDCQTIVTANHNFFSGPRGSRALTEIEFELMGWDLKPISLMNSVKEFGPTRRSSVSSEYSQGDWAVIRLAKPVQDCFPLKIAESQEAETIAVNAHQLYRHPTSVSWGSHPDSPTRFWQSVSQLGCGELIDAEEHNKQNFDRSDYNGLILHTLPQLPGDSGSPIIAFNRDGRVVVIGIHLGNEGSNSEEKFFSDYALQPPDARYANFALSFHSDLRAAIQRVSIGL